MNLAHKILAGAALAVSMTGASYAADLLAGPIDPIYSSPLFNFEGLYIGATAGGALSNGAYGTLGVVVGSNFAITDGLIAGVEFQGTGYFNGAGLTTYDALALGRVGAFLADNTMIYGELGAGVADSNFVYALGAGVEMAMTDQLAVRGELQGLGAWGAGPSVGKATVGLIWHIN
jgi:outer membrane immunogenic protein